jgi:hypothetical protein
LAAAANLPQLRQGFAQPSADSRIMMRWWWFGPAVTKTELERELRAMKAGGIGGVEIQPVYPYSIDNPAQGIRNLTYLSPEFLDALQFAAAKARELGLRVDLTLGSGWPYGGPHISLDQAAGRLRIEKNAGAPLKAGESVVAAFPDQGVTFIAGHTRMMVKRASVGAEGFVLDHYNRAALDKHLSTVGEPLLKALGPHPPFAVFCDSLEVFGSDWATDLLPEFQRRRGYDLKPELPALIGELDARKGAVRNDWAQTLAELAEERFLRPAQQWAHQHGTQFRAQTYGTPPVTLSSQRFVDLADGEQPQWKTLTPSRWAASANHILGRPVTATETWTWLHSPSFAATPLDVKTEADRHFLQGVNQLIGHGWPYSPESAGKPGWAFYAAASFNDNNPWWIVMPDLSAYLQRISWLMRQGTPVTDVALYLPVSDIRARFTAGSGRASIDRLAHEVIGDHVLPQILESGFTFDLVDDGLLDEALRQGYKAVVLPNVERIPPATYRKLEQFAQSGGLVLAAGRKPALSPGLTRAAEDAAEISAITRRLFDANGSAGRFVPDVQQLGAALKQRLTPDAAFSPANPELGFFHRRVGAADVYFLANTSNQPWRGKVRFRAKELPVEWWDAFTGGPLAAAGEIELAPYGSAVAVVSKESRPLVAPQPQAPLTQDLSTGWTVSFDGLNQTVSMPALRCWTDDEATRSFSGTAVYEKEIHVPATLWRDGRRVMLDFGEGTPLPAVNQPAGMRASLAAPVRDAAVVYLNGKRAGSVWTAPFRLDITSLLKEGRNTLRIQVANTALNRMAAQGAPEFRELTAKYGERFQMQDMKNMKPEPSGLLGPVRLVAK